MSRPLSHFCAALVLAATTVLATACAPAADDDAGRTAAPSPVATSPTPTPTVTEVEQPTDEPTCETIIPSSIVEDFESVGWTARAEPFRFAETEHPDGVQCVWGDFSVATDHVQIFGWAPITAQAAKQAQDKLVASGWRLEESADGVIVTESLDTAISPVDGYGLTYLFGDGWVKYADTKQGLLLVVWPAVS